MKDEARETWRWRWVDELAQDLRYALRQLGANPAFATATVLTLALGIGATTMMYSVRRSYAAHERGLASVERLVYVGQGPKDCQGCTEIASGNYVAIRGQTRALEHVSMIADWEPVLRGAAGAELVDGARVTTEFFRVLDIRPLLGRTIVQRTAQPIDTRSSCSARRCGQTCSLRTAAFSAEQSCSIELHTRSWA